MLSIVVFLCPSGVDIDEPGVTPIRYFFFFSKRHRSLFEFESKGCHMSRCLLFFLVLWGGLHCVAVRGVVVL